MNKLAEQGYDYLYDRADLALVKQYQEAIEAITFFSEPAQAELERTFPRKGFIWLTFYHETAQDVETLAAQPSDPYNLHDDALWQHLEQQQQQGTALPSPPSPSPTNQETPEFRPFKQRLEAHQSDMREGIV
jgi:hypothetical protein